MSATLVEFKDKRPDTEELALRPDVLEDQPLSPYGILRTQSGSDTLKYQETAMYPVVVTALQGLIARCMWPGWEIVPQNNYEEFPQFENKDKRIIDEINFQLNNFGFAPVSDVLTGMLENAITYGYSVAEVNWKDKPENGLWRIQNIKTKPSFNFDIYIDRDETISSLL